MNAMIMMLAVCSQIDLFWGSGGVELRPSVGPARGWNWEKAQSGNTHPGAVLPFGWVSACPYSGGYPTGYGSVNYSWSGPYAMAYPNHVALGVSHFHNSGTGWINKFYNYLLVTPSVVGSNTGKPSALVNEVAEPGYYSARLADYGTTIELTTRKYAACHRYHFEGKKGFITINANNIGLRPEFVKPKNPYYEQERVEAVAVNKAGNEDWQGTIRANGIDLHFAVKIAGKVVNPVCRDGVGGGEIEGNEAEVFVGFSLVSVDEAKERAEEAAKVGFDETRKEAAAIWAGQLDKIAVKFTRKNEASIFNSAFYHALVKPVDCGTGYVDFSTFWDIYKTELPLIFALDRRVARGILEHLMAVTEKRGFAPICQLMDSAIVHKDMQATAIPVYTLSDGYWRQALTKADYSRIKRFFEREFAHADITGMSPTHAIDLSGAYMAASWVARDCGDEQYADELATKSALWKTVYDEKTGLLVKDAVYYEGNNWNYSFRPHPGMNERVTLAGGVGRFVGLLDKFFAFDGVPADWSAEQDRIRRPNHFEGLNNESDMETPYAYIWAGRVDRVAQLNDLIRRCRFAVGVGGCPGNNDSGATGSWYMLSALGIFPLTGTPYYLLGSPSVESAEIKFAAGTLAIEVRRDSANSIYPKGYEFNGKAFREPWLKVRDLEAGGKLTFILGDRPVANSPIPNWL